ncbi:MAG: uroporphyrinogen decarboxylase family protein [Spirochaetota bacterium]
MVNESLRKPDVNRLLAVMRGEIPDRVPIFEILIEPRNVKALLGKDVGSTMAASRGATDTVGVAPPMDPADFMEICNKVSMDAMTIEALWTPLKYRDDKGDIHVVTDGRIKDWESLEKAIRPDWETDLKPRRDIVRNYVKAAQGTGIGVNLCFGAFFQACYFFLCEFNTFLLKVYEDREFVETLMDICVDYYIQLAEMGIEEGIDFLFFADDIAFKTGTFMEPELFKELWLPRAKRLLQPAKDAGIPVMFHSCGNLTDIMDNIVMEMGIDVLNPIEPYSMDIFDIKDRYGDKLTLSGNIDIAGPLAFGTPEDAAKEVREKVEYLKKGGRYILSTNHSIMDDIPPENYRAMIETGLEHGVYS